MYFWLPIVPPLAKGIHDRWKAKEVCEIAESDFKTKYEELKAETENTKSAIKKFRREKFYAVRNELKRAEKVLSKFYGKRVLEIGNGKFFAEKIPDENEDFNFGAFGKKSSTVEFLEIMTLLNPFVFVFIGQHKLDEAYKLKHRTCIICEFMEQRIQMLKALHKRICEGRKVLKFLRRKLKRLFDAVKVSEKSDPLIFERILKTALMLKRIVEIEVCSSDGKLSQEAEKMFRDVLMEVA